MNFKKYIIFNFFILFLVLYKTQFYSRQNNINHGSGHSRNSGRGSSGHSRNSSGRGSGNSSNLNVSNNNQNQLMQQTIQTNIQISVAYSFITKFIQLLQPLIANISTIGIGTKILTILNPYINSMNNVQGFFNQTQLNQFLASINDIKNLINQTQEIKEPLKDQLLNELNNNMEIFKNTQQQLSQVPSVQQIPLQTQQSILQQNTQIQTQNIIQLLNAAINQLKQMLQNQQIITNTQIVQIINQMINIIQLQITQLNTGVINEIQIQQLMSGLQQINELISQIYKLNPQMEQFIFPFTQTILQINSLLNPKLTQQSIQQAQDKTTQQQNQRFYNINNEQEFISTINSIKTLAIGFILLNYRDFPGSWDIPYVINLKKLLEDQNIVNFLISNKIYVLYLNSFLQEAQNLAIKINLADAAGNHPVMYVIPVSNINYLIDQSNLKTISLIKINAAGNVPSISDFINNIKNIFKIN
jgi:hypothetical protein